MSKEIQEQTKKCKHCQSDIPKKAKVCPNCRKKQGGILKWIIIVIVVLILFACASGGGESEEKGSDSNPKSVGTVDSKASSSDVAEEIDNEFEVGEIVETSNLRITFVAAGEYKSDNQFMQPESGNTFYKMDFEFENISEIDQYVSSFNFKCYADDYDMEQRYFDSLTLDATLSKGKKTKGSVFFEVPKDAKEITLEYETNYWTEDKIVFIVK